MLQLVVNRAMEFGTAFESVVGTPPVHGVPGIRVLARGCGIFGTALLAVDKFDAAGAPASTNAVTGKPPSVSASAAFSAQDTLTSRMRGCVAWPEGSIPTQRDSP